jgi:hypothetical protein
METGVRGAVSPGNWRARRQTAGLQPRRLQPQAAIGAANTPLSIGPDGRIYSRNAEHLFAIRLK